MAVSLTEQIKEQNKETKPNPNASCHLVLEQLTSRTEVKKHPFKSSTHCVTEKKKGKHNSACNKQTVVPTVGRAVPCDGGLTD